MRVTAATRRLWYTPLKSERRSIVWKLVMLQRERQRRVRLGIELEADALLSISGVQAYSIALKRAEEASSDEMAKGWSGVAAAIGRRTAKRRPLLAYLLH